MAAGEPLDPHYYAWREMVRGMPDLPVGQMIAHITPHLSEAEIKAYDAPFPDIRYKAGARTFPELAMVEPQMDGVKEAKAAMEFWNHEWSGQSFMVIGEKAADAKAMHTLHRQIKRCPAPLVLEEANHFVPEWGEQIALAALKAFGDL